MAAGRQREMVSEEVNAVGGKTSLGIGLQFSAAAPDFWLFVNRYSLLNLKAQISAFFD